MTSRELAKKCLYNDCDYVSKASTTFALEHNLSSHVSNLHRATTAVWYKGSKMAIHRDVKLNSFTCPCGDYTSRNAALVRSHATKMHKSTTKATSAAPMAPSGKSVSVRASASVSTVLPSKRASSAVSKCVASTSTSVLRPPQTSASTAGPSTSHNVSASSKREVEEPTPGPSKVRRVNNTPSMSASRAVASSSKTVTHISAPKPLFGSASARTRSKMSAATSAGSVSTSASKKRPADGSTAEPSSSKVQRVSKWPTMAERNAAKAAKPPQNAAPLKTLAPRTRPIVFIKDNAKKTRTVSNAPSVPAAGSAESAPTAAQESPPRPRLVIKFRIPPWFRTRTQPVAAPAVHPTPKPKKHPLATGVAASASSALSSTTGTPAAVPSTIGKCSGCGEWVDPYGKKGICTMCYVGSLLAAPPPPPAPVPAPPPMSLRCATCGAERSRKGKGSECTKCQLRALPVTNGGTASEREFERWFAKWTAARRAAATADEDEDEDEGNEDEGRDGDRDRDKTDWWRVEWTRAQGGVCYPTADTFFAALEVALWLHRESAKRREKANGEGAGAGGVLTFFGGYSIVAQPEIPALARLDKVVAQMQKIGFRLGDALLGYVKLPYASAGGTMDHVFKYPCTCGGTPPHVAANAMGYARHTPEEKYVGKVCGGTIMLMVGEDNALSAYGIPGQHIAVGIVH